MDWRPQHNVAESSTDRKVSPLGKWKDGRTVAPGSQRPRQLRYYHGMRPEQWAQMFAEQDGRCYLCGRALPSERAKIVIDHDHDCCQPSADGHSFSCGLCRRGLACPRCNTLIALADEDTGRCG